MKQLLIKFAYYILQKYSLETLPFLYFNGAEYTAKGVEYKHAPDGKETLIVTAERRGNKCTQ